VRPVDANFGVDSRYDLLLANFFFAGFRDFLNAINSETAEANPSNFGCFPVQDRHVAFSLLSLISLGAL
jgi:hypothetical protein